MVLKMTADQLPVMGPDSTTRVLDIRPRAAYNGWKLQGEARGGHIPGAISLPASWVDRIGTTRLVDLLARRGVTPTDPLLVYGYGDGAATELTARLHTLGYDDASVLAGGQQAWAGNPGRALATLPGFRSLVHPEWLAAQLAGEPVEAAPKGPTRLFHVGFGAAGDYERGHIPGAVHLDTRRLESAESRNRRTAGELDVALREAGITKDTTVVLYGNDTAIDPPQAHPGQMAATRAAAILLYAGVEDVRLVDGGFTAWCAAEFPTQTSVRLPVAAEEFGANIPSRPDVFIDYDEAVDLLGDPRGVLVSVRTRDEHTGVTSGYEFITTAGDIPGARWAESGRDPQYMDNYRSGDNTMRDYNEITRRWKDLGITPDKRVAFYCGTGWRASEAYFYARLMGWADISIYDGGWFEWSKRNPPS